MTGPLPATDDAADSAAKHAAVVAQEATAYEPPTAPEGTAADESPALAGVIPEQTPEEATDGVDMDSMPEFKSEKGQLPSARIHMKAQLAAIQKSVPESWQDGEAVNEEDALNDLGALEGLFVKIEDLVLERAADRDEMAAWLCDQDNGEGALMAAFGRLSEQLGNS